MQAAISNANPVFGLYTNNTSAPLQAQAGLRQFYDFGFYSYCAYVDGSAGICGNQSVGLRYTPYDVVTADMAQNYTIITKAIIPENSTFRDSNYLGDITQAGYWLILLATICTALALLTSAAQSCCFLTLKIHSQGHRQESFDFLPFYYFLPRRDCSLTNWRKFVDRRDQEI